MLKLSFMGSAKNRNQKGGHYDLSTGNMKRIVLVLFASAIWIMSSTGCALKVAAATTTTTTTTNPSAVVTTLSKTTTTTTPALTQTSFTLTLVPPQTSAGYTLPVYLTANSTLHLVWTVSGVGENMRMKFDTPNGSIVEVEPDGSFVTISSDDPCDQLNTSGSLILKPAVQKWTGGYYVFYPYICDDDPAVSVKLMYWIEQQP